jgi:hypothetical protein
MFVLKSETHIVGVVIDAKAFVSELIDSFISTKMAYLDFLQQQQQQIAITMAMKAKKGNTIKIHNGTP